MCRRILWPLALVLASSGAGAAAERLTDEQVKKLIEDIDDGYRVWKKELEKKNFDDAVIRSAERTVKVKDFLKDFDKNIDVLKSRFKPDYAATPDVLTLLRRGSDVALYSRQGGATPDSAWTALETKLDALARSYSVAFPVTNMDARASRLGDGELSNLVKRMEQSAKHLRNDADKAAKADKTIDKATRESLKGSILQIEKTAKDVGTRIKEDRPAAGEVGQLLSQADGLKQTLAKLKLDTAARPSWTGIQAASDALTRAYALNR